VTRASGADRIARLVDDRPMGRLQWLTVVLCGLVMFLDGFDTQTIGYMAPYIAKEWHLTKAMLGPIFSAAQVGLVIGYVGLAPLSDRFGHKRVVAGGTLAFALSTLSCLLARDVTSLTVLRFVLGLSLGVLPPSAVALTGEYSPRRHRASFVLAIYCGFSLGFVAAGIACGELIPALGWRSVFCVGAALPLALAPFLFLLLPEALSTLSRPGADPRAALAAFRRLDPGFREEDLAAIGPAGPAADAHSPVRRLFADGLGCGTLLLWGVFLINLGEFYAIQSWMPTILTDLGLNNGTIVAATTLFEVGGIISAFIIGPLMDRMSPYLTLGLLYAAGVLFVAGVGHAVAAPPAVLFAATFLAGLCVSGGQKGVIALAAVFYPAEIRSTGVGWALGAARPGGIAGPLIVGAALSAGVTPQGVFYLLAAPMAVLAVTIVLMGRRYGAHGAANRPRMPSS
jgi:AAHS family 4-hydroxybenzoate transporter-like MFS transporter